MLDSDTEKFLEDNKEFFEAGKKAHLDFIKSINDILDSEDFKVNPFKYLKHDIVIIREMARKLIKDSEL